MSSFSGRVERRSSAGALCSWCVAVGDPMPCVPGEVAENDSQGRLPLHEVKEVNFSDICKDLRTFN